MPLCPSSVYWTRTLLAIPVVNVWPGTICAGLERSVVVGLVNAGALPGVAAKAASHRTLAPLAPFGPLRI